MSHIPVLKKEVVQYLDPKPNENFVDCTFGNGGHALAILERIKPNGMVLGIDWEQETISRFKPRKNLILVCDNFSNLKKIVKQKRFGPVNGVLLDLGMSTWHIKESGKGFSFLSDEPLDMRYNRKINQLTAEQIINEWSENKIAEILKQYGEERFARLIAREISKQRKGRPIETTFQLVEIIKKAVPGWYRQKRIHPATKTFQALRITVNQELENLKSVLPQCLDILGSGGRLVAISFHSLEDRIVKRFFKENKHKFTILTPKPIRPGEKEIKLNPSSRSARLRAGQKKYD
jgi:16S rRNA (cytosine1402-N4)-methyltransferase